MKNFLCKLLKCCPPTYGVPDAMARLNEVVKPTEGFVVRDEAFKSKEPTTTRKFTVIIFAEHAILTTEEDNLEFAVNKILAAYRQT